MYDLVIFDLDGTLIDSVGDIADALNQTLGTTHPDSTVAGWVGSGVRVLLERAGVAPAHVDADPPCTKCHPDRFFSYRRDGLEGGVHMGFIYMS